MIQHLPIFHRALDIYALSFAEHGAPIQNVVKVKNAGSERTREKMDFVVCLKEVFYPFEDRSLQLAEWLELQKLLGANKVIAFATGEFQHPRVAQVLRLVELNQLVLGPKTKSSFTQWSSIVNILYNQVL